MAGKEADDEVDARRIEQQNAIARANATSLLQVSSQGSNFFPQLRVRQPLLNRFHIGENVGSIVGAVARPSAATPKQNCLVAEAGCR